jgi:hypothetical protein
MVAMVTPPGLRHTLGGIAQRPRIARYCRFRLGGNNLFSIGLGIRGCTAGVVFGYLPRLSTLGAVLSCSPLFSL